MCFWWLRLFRAVVQCAFSTRKHQSSQILNPAKRSTKRDVVTYTKDWMHKKARETVVVCTLVSTKMSGSVQPNYIELSGFLFDNVFAGIVEPVGVGEVCVNGTLTCYKEDEGNGFLLLFQDTFNGDQRRTAIKSRRIIQMTKRLTTTGDMGVTNITADREFQLYETTTYVTDDNQYQETKGADIESSCFVFHLPKAHHDKLHEKIGHNGAGAYF